MSEGDLDITCPYCDARFHTSRPAISRKNRGKGKIEENNVQAGKNDLMGFPHEIRCLPYTRDVGRYDPKEESDWYASEQWSRIGKDYFSLDRGDSEPSASRSRVKKYKNLISFFTWERIGILRIDRDNLKVYYRVQRCESCGALFDVFANYTKDRNGSEVKLREFWKHLFTPNQHRESELCKYNGESWFIWLMSRLGKVFRSVYMVAVLIGLVLYGIGIIPLALHDKLGLLEAMMTNEAILYGIASFSVVIIILTLYNYFQYMSHTADFGELFAIAEQQKAVGLNFWRNYTLSRFVGVQTGEGVPKPSQVDIFAGLLSIGLMLMIWFTNHPQWFVTVIIFTIAILFFLVALKFWRLEKSRQSVSVVNAFGIAAIAGMVWSVWKWSGLPEAGLVLTDLFFWSVVAYFWGHAAWLAMNTTFYILQGVQRIPMHLSPYNNYTKIKPLRTLQHYSIGAILVIFIAVIAVVTVVESQKTSRVFLRRSRVLLENSQQLLVSRQALQADNLTLLDKSQELIRSSEVASDSIKIIQQSLPLLPIENMTISDSVKITEAVNGLSYLNYVLHMNSKSLAKIDQTLTQDLDQILTGSQLIVDTSRIMQAQSELKQKEEGKTKGPFYWLFGWMTLGLAIMFGSIGLGVGQGEFLGLAGFYILLSKWMENSPNIQIANVEPVVIILGIFFTLLVGLQIFRTETIIRDLLIKAKDKELQRIHAYAENIFKQLNQIEQSLEHGKHELTKEQLSELCEQRELALKSIDSTLALEDRIEKSVPRINILQKGTQLVTPLITSIILPELVTYYIPRVLGGLSG